MDLYWLLIGSQTGCPCVSASLVLSAEGLLYVVYSSIFLFGHLQHNCVLILWMEWIWVKSTSVLCGTTIIMEVEWRKWMIKSDSSSPSHKNIRVQKLLCLCNRLVETAKYFTLFLCYTDSSKSVILCFHDRTTCHRTLVYICMWTCTNLSLRLKTFASLAYMNIFRLAHTSIYVYITHNMGLYIIM